LLQHEQAGVRANPGEARQHLARHHINRNCASCACSSLLLLLSLPLHHILSKRLDEGISRNLVASPIVVLLCWHLLEPTSTQRSSLQRLHVVSVRPVSPGRSGKRPTNVTRAGSNRGDARRVVLGSAGQLGRLQTSRR
jgi:hypothetical protein